MIKVHDRKKAPLYLTPFERRVQNEARDSRERARCLPERRRPGLCARRHLVVRKCPEGFGPQFEIAGETDFGPLESFFRELMDMRSAAA
jgi:hypothetical protein